MNESDFDFWISVEDLVEFFDNVYIAHQSSDTMAGLHCDGETQESFVCFETVHEHFFPVDIKINKILKMIKKQRFRFAGIVQQLDPSIVSLVRSGVFGNWIKDKTDGGAPNNVCCHLFHVVLFLSREEPSEGKLF